MGGDARLLIGDDRIDETVELTQAAINHPLAAAYRSQLPQHPLKVHRHPRVIIALAEVGRCLRAAGRAA